MGQYIAAFGMSGLFGYLIVYGFLAMKLNQHNNVGDSHGDANLYSNNVIITDRVDNLPVGLSIDAVTIQGYVAAHAPKKAEYPTASNGQEQVTRPQQ